jgi:hypothetical protein
MLHSPERVGISHSHCFGRQGNVMRDNVRDRQEFVQCQPLKAPYGHRHASCVVDAATQSRYRSGNALRDFAKSDEANDLAANFADPIKSEYPQPVRVLKSRCVIPRRCQHQRRCELRDCVAIGSRHIGDGNPPRFGHG